MAHTFSNPSNDMSQLKKDIGCLLGIQAPWKISEVTFAHEAQEVRIHVAYEDGPTAAALTLLAMVRTDMANIRSSGSASLGLICCRQVAVAGVR